MMNQWSEMEAVDIADSADPAAAEEASMLQKLSKLQHSHIFQLQMCTSSPSLPVMSPKAPAIPRPAMIYGAVNIHSCRW